MNDAAETEVEEKGKGEVFFYHLTRAPLEAALPMLLDRSLQAGWRVCVRGPNEDRLNWLDERLWLHPEDSFLPHGRAGNAQEASQPILLTGSDDIPNDADALMSIEGAEISEPEMRQHKRVFVVFDGNDPDAVAHARTQWMAVKQAGVTAKYWSQESGRWEMKASTEPDASS
ncbi:DNA polymerase III subunit chi [Aliiroseovarius sp. F20344]|uniref:DNA polymerase III subunit chi n=1 Tax=Aliiroseovarius sp. F20344 TaxID=2926414 RepID=UPI001FF473E2|nr:DNA polymerase III subunit chi [Aliiroseovarius sp. F20344]MCK0143489.1 DNA polymerase III subunit chi [Aliiroseovarius sp. F20344]